jgi:RNA polymerase sigma-70 factor, ECF subfamily
VKVAYRKMEEVQMTLKMTDAELVRAFQGKDTQAYEELVTRYLEKVYNLAWRITRLPEDAEEILQEVFIAVFNKISEFQGKSAFSSWLYRITVNTAFMKLRKRKKHSALSLDETILSGQENWIGQRSDTSDVNYLSSRHELRAVLQGAISRLPAEYKTIFILRDVDGLSNQEVGEILGLSVPAIKSRLHRSRLILRKKLRQFHEDWVNSKHVCYGARRSELDEDYKEAA